VVDANSSRRGVKQFLPNLATSSQGEVEAQAERRKTLLSETSQDIPDTGRPRSSGAIRSHARPQGQARDWPRIRQGRKAPGFARHGGRSQGLAWCFRSTIRSQDRVVLAPGPQVLARAVAVSSGRLRFARVEGNSGRRVGREIGASGSQTGPFAARRAGKSAEVGSSREGSIATEGHSAPQGADGSGPERRFGRKVVLSPLEAQRPQGRGSRFDAMRGRKAWRCRRDVKRVARHDEVSRRLLSDRKILESGKADHTVRSRRMPSQDWPAMGASR